MVHLPAHRASPEPNDTRTATSHLLLFTTISALDGTILMLAASGTFHDPWTATVAGLTVVAGAGAWLSARRAFAGGCDWKRLVRVAIPAALATTIAALVGAHLGSLHLTVLPKAAGVALLLIAAEVAGWRLPRVQRLPVPVPLALIAFALPLEVLAHWTP